MVCHTALILKTKALTTDFFCLHEKEIKVNLLHTTTHNLVQQQELAWLRLWSINTYSLHHQWRPWFVVILLKWFVVILLEWFVVILSSRRITTNHFRRITTNQGRHWWCRLYVLTLILSFGVDTYLRYHFLIHKCLTKIDMKFDFNMFKH